MAHNEIRENPFRVFGWNDAIDSAIKLLASSNKELLLTCGEMTSKELRLVKSVLLLKTKQLERMKK